MSSATAKAPAGPQSARRSATRFALMRLHSLAGVVPLGLFLLEHLYTNAVAMFGEAAYNRQIGRLQSLPFLGAAEIVFIALPLLYHAVYGIYIASIARNNATRYSYRNNWLFVLQRASGIVTLLFVLAHLWAIRLAALFYGTTVDYQHVQQHVSQPLVLVLYAIGSIGATFHFTNGMAAALVTWGITVGPRSQELAARIGLGLFAALSCMWIAVLLAF
ncbi:MAG: succinate dehydrogenase [Paenibacillaceae bacterium]|nr:succinate dehydrogenase [Paenibacillaceae bacterium]